MYWKSTNYNLLEEEWIPVLYRDGRWDRVGIRIALQEAGRIRQIAASNPMDRVAILRLLLAVLQWCKPVASEEELAQLRDRAVNGIPPHWLESRLGVLGDPNPVFDLLDSAKPFLQDVTLWQEIQTKAQKAVDKKLHKVGRGIPPEERSRRLRERIKDLRNAAINLMHELPSGTNIAHFRHTRDDHDGMCLVCCAVALPRWACISSAGTAGPGQSMTASLHGNTPAYSVPGGQTLLAALTPSWPNLIRVEGDAPVWEDANQESALGFLKGMTWRCRRILLAPPGVDGEREFSTGRCCCCGKETKYLVTKILFRPGWQRPSREPWFDDPHLLWMIREGAQRGKGKRKHIVPSWPNPDDALEHHGAVWRSVWDGLLQRSSDRGTYATQVTTLLLGTSQQLYKHAFEHTANMRGLKPHVADSLLGEIQWLKEVTWRTTAARTRTWEDPPKGHWIVEALYTRGTKAHGIRSALCARSPSVEQELEKALDTLGQRLRTASCPGGCSGDPIVREWKRAVRNALQNAAGNACQSVTPGSAIRRREAMRQALETVRHAAGQVNAQMSIRGGTNETRDGPKSGTVSRRSGKPRQSRRKETRT